MAHRGELTPTRLKQKTRLILHAVCARVPACACVCVCFQGGMRVTFHVHLCSYVLMLTRKKQALIEFEVSTFYPFTTQKTPTSVCMLVSSASFRLAARFSPRADYVVFSVVGHSRCTQLRGIDTGKSHCVRSISSSPKQTSWLTRLRRLGTEDMNI